MSKKKNKEIIEDDYLNSVEEVNLSEESSEELICDDKLDEDTLEEIMEEEYDEFDIKFSDGQNKHKLEGKHRLERDIIFQGRPEAKVDDEIIQSNDFDFNSDIYKFEPHELSENDNSYVNRELENDIYNILSTKTNLDFSQNRRKPKREDFNTYFKLLINTLKAKYTYSEIFVCLSYYFTDNIYNMFKILDKKYVSTIIKELKDKGYLRDVGHVDFI